jgi:hypothetical protein
VNWLKLSEDEYVNLDQACAVKPALLGDWRLTVFTVDGPEVVFNTREAVAALRARLDRLSGEQAATDYHHREEWWHRQNQATK